MVVTGCSEPVPSDKPHSVSTPVAKPAMRAEPTATMTRSVMGAVDVLTESTPAVTAKTTTEMSVVRRMSGRVSGGQPRFCCHFTWATVPRMSAAANSQMRGPKPESVAPARVIAMKASCQGTTATWDEMRMSSE